MKVSASKFIDAITELDPEYILVPEKIDLSGVEVLRMERSEGAGYVYPDGVYWDRNWSRFEELVTVKA